MALLEDVNKERIPEHVAIIMDGNGRWAKSRNLDRTFGHKEGADSVRAIIEAGAKLRMKYITLYTFSTENWNRPDYEVETLMQLLVDSVIKETPALIKNNIKLTAIGDIQRLPEHTLKALNQCIEDTSVSTGLNLVIAISYSSKWEITKAVRNIAEDFSKGVISTIDESVISDYLETKNMPDPDLLIRTGGESRISNFLLWQLAYSELYFTDCLWPDFREANFYGAILDYQKRERRFGKTSEQIKS